MYKPSLVQAQLKLRDGGLSGKYQWIRLYEIKVFLHQYKTSLFYAHRIETLDSQLGILTCHYQFDLGDNYYEMAYVDGPTNWMQNSKDSVSDNHDPYGLLPNSDIVLMKKEPKF
jgi:hypothetical protein